MCFSSCVAVVQCVMWTSAQLLDVSSSLPPTRLFLHACLRYTQTSRLLQKFSSKDIVWLSFSVLSNIDTGTTHEMNLLEKKFSDTSSAL